MHFERPFSRRLDWALATIGLASIAKGYATLDAMVKKAIVKVEIARPVSPGRFVIAVCGEIADVEESYCAGLSMAGSGIIDHIFLPNPHEQLRTKRVGTGKSALIAECDTVSSTILAADAALKNCDVALGSMKLADGLGGKGFCVFYGDLCEINEAANLLKRSLAPERIVALESIAAPHSEISGFL